MNGGIGTGASTASSIGILSASASATQGNGKGGAKAFPFAHAFESLTGATSQIMHIPSPVMLGSLSALTPFNADAKIPGIMGSAKGGKR
jgi:hypothetical protein